MKNQISLALLAISVTAVASDHNNLEAGRPLSFDDAYSIGYRSYEFQTGVRFTAFSRARQSTALTSEVQYGFAKNKDISIGFEPSFSAENGKILGNRVEIGYFEGVAREIHNLPAWGYRLTAGLPVSGGKGLELQGRLIFTKTAGHYDKVHLNLDVSHQTDPTAGERQTTFGLVLGYSNPIGYPKRFDKTFLAEFGLEQSRDQDGGWNSWLGVGVRKQVSPVAVLDLGIQTDLSKSRNELRSPIRLTAGYSVRF